MAIDNHFEDEPVLGGIDKFEDVPVSSKTIQFDGLKQATSKAERRRERRRRRYERTGKIAACILIVCIIIAVVLSVTLVKEAEHVLYQDSLLDESESPTTSPTVARHTLPFTPSPTILRKPTFSVLTPSPTVRHTASPNVAMHTDSPTITSVPTSILQDSYSFEPVGDTYIHLDGPHKTKRYGNEETLWVQRGNKESTLPGREVTIPTIVGILEFDTTKETSTTKALPKRSRWPEGGEKDQVKVTLRIHHVAKSDSDGTTDELSVEEILPINIGVYRLPNNKDLVVESLTGEDFQNAPKSFTSGTLIAQQMVGATDTVLDIDVTSAMFLPEGTTTGYADDQVLLLLKVYWEETPREGDLFETRESDDRSPQLIFSNMV